MNAVAWTPGVQGAAMPSAWAAILATARWYPSPHNSQPMRVRIVASDRAEIYYDLDRGLPAQPDGIPFSVVTAGVFLELLAIAAHGSGFTVDERLNSADVDFSAGDRLHRVAVVTLVPAARPVTDLDPALTIARRTSRLPYSSRRADRAVIEEVTREAARWGHRLETTAAGDIIDAVADLNQRTLFDDLADDAVRHELRTWLRYSRAEASRRGDGLSAECLNMPGLLLRWFFTHHRLWSRRGAKAVARWLYLRSMRGIGQLAWLTGPFGTVVERQRAGRMFIRLWLMLTAHGVAMHPFGSVITNARSRRDLCRLVGVDASKPPGHGGATTWMLFRLGYSAPPPRSHRRPAADLLLPAEVG